MNINNLFSDDALKKLISYIIKSANQNSIIDDINIATDSTYSSYNINNLHNSLRTELKNYTDYVTNALTKLTCKKTTVIPDSKCEKNVIFLYSENGEAPFIQYLRIDDSGEVINLGSTSITLTDYYTKSDTDEKFALNTDLDLLKEMVSASLTESDIVNTIDSTNTDDQIPSAKAVYNNSLNKANKLKENIKKNQILVDDGEGNISASGLAIADLEKSSNSSSSESDIPIIPIDRCANNIYVLRQNNLISSGGEFNEDYANGYVFAGAHEMYLNKKFNKIKMIVSYPGLVRIGIVNKHIADPNPRYSKCLVKWLISEFAAYTGFKEWDIEDTIITDPDHYLFVECKCGSSGAYQNNTNSAYTSGKITYPANSATTGLLPASSYDSVENDKVFKSNSVLTTSARFTYNGSVANKSSATYRNWLSIDYDDAGFDINAVNYVTGDLNLGIYEKGSNSDTYYNRVLENALSVSDPLRAWIPPLQDRLVGKTLYAFRFDVAQIGFLTIHHCRMNDSGVPEIIQNWTIYVRAIGLQTIRLPKDIVLKTNEFLAFGGYHVCSTPTDIVPNACKWCYIDRVGVADWTKFPINSSLSFTCLVFDSKDPSKITSYYNNSDTNNSYLNLCLIERGSTKSKLEDLYFSVTGDSITSYANFITKKSDFPAGNSAGDNSYFYPKVDVNNIDATWWGIIAKDCRMRLLRNDAWSGSKVSGNTTTSLGYNERYKLLSNTQNPDRTKTTLPFGNPNIILSMIGTNDLSGNVALGEADYSNYNYGQSSILGAFNSYCGHLLLAYPNTMIVHFIIPRGTSAVYMNSNKVTIAQLASKMSEVASAAGQYFIPYEYFCRLNYANVNNVFCKNVSWYKETNMTISTDSLHPNAIGMEMVADGVKRYLESIMG